MENASPQSISPRELETSMAGMESSGCSSKSAGSRTQCSFFDSLCVRNENLAREQQLGARNPKKQQTVQEKKQGTLRRAPRTGPVRHTGPRRTLAVIPFFLLPRHTQPYTAADPAPLTGPLSNPSTRAGRNCWREGFFQILTNIYLPAND